MSPSKNFDYHQLRAGRASVFGYASSKTTRPRKCNCWFDGVVSLNEGDIVAVREWRCWHWWYARHAIISCNDEVDAFTVFKQPEIEEPEIKEEPEIQESTTEEEEPEAEEQLKISLDRKSGKRNQRRYRWKHRSHNLQIIV